MKPASIDIDARTPVWKPPSELYLDVDYRDNVRAVASKLAESPSSLDQLHSILRIEIHPVLAANLCAPAGVWDGFDQQWLARQIVRNKRRRWWRSRPCCSRRLLRHFRNLLEPRIRRRRTAMALLNPVGR